ncbi:MAG: hypothetical protein U0W65_00175 [Bacteroidia bacterium]
MRDKYIWHYLIFILCLLKVVNSYSNTYSIIDSLTQDRIVKKGKLKLYEQIQQNDSYIKEGKTDKLNFVVTLTPEDYITDIAVSNRPTFVSSTAAETNFNSRLNQIYQDEGIECYYLLINYFDVKMAAEMPETSKLEDVFKEGSFYDKNSNIQNLKLAHESITLGILYGQNNSNRKKYVVSIANYCCAEFNNATGGTGCFKLYTINSVKPQNSQAVAYFDEIYDYYKGYLKNDESFKTEVGRDLTVDKMITDFEKSVKNYKKKALILQTNTTNDLKTILSFFSTQDYQLLSNEERTHILKVFCGGLIWNTTETEILSILNTTPNNSVNTILNNLITIDVNSKRLLKHLFDGFQQGNYRSLVTRLCQMVGNSTLSQYNLPEVEAEIQANQISPSWSRVFEWSDCSNTTMFMEEANTDECKRPSHWKHAEKRYFTITMNSLGAIEINGKIKKVENVISSNGAYNVTLENISPSTLNPYDLIVFVDKSTIEGLNDITETSGGTMVVPALFLVYAKDKAFNSDAFDAAMTLTSIVGVEEILAGKILAKLSGFKRLLKVFRKTEVVVQGGSIAEDITNFYTLDRAIQSKNLVEQFNLTQYAAAATKDEVVAIHRYTVNNYELTQAAYSSGYNNIQQSWVNLINSGLIKMSTTNKYMGKVYRGTKLKQEYLQPYLDAWSSLSKIIKERPFLSASKRIDVAQDFINRNPSEGFEVIFEIESKTGVYIDDISDYGKYLQPSRHSDRLVQEEVLLMQNKDFEISNLQAIMEAGKTRYYIKMREL